MSPEEIEDWRRAGKMAAEALAFGAKLITPGASVKDVCDKIDGKIVELGGRPAWPTQVSLNDCAAHFTPDPDETRVFKDEVVCLDVGVHVNGRVGDNACTVDLSGKHQGVVDASKAALEAAAKVLKIGMRVNEVGKVIQREIESRGFRPIRNLSGHTIKDWEIHAHPSVPNYDDNDDAVLEDGQVIAIEPFATDGVGSVYEMDQANIFSLGARRPVRSQYARDALAFIEKNYRNLPFTTRWLAKELGVGKAGLAIRELIRAGCLHQHPPLVEQGHGMVAVTEATFLIGKKVERLTPDLVSD